MQPRLRLLGGLSVLAAGGKLELPPHKTSCLLVYLAVQDNWVLRESLAFLFWPDSDETTARRNLRQLLQRARGLDWAPALEMDRERVRWPVDSDVLEFRQAMAHGRSEDALSLYSGRFAEGLSLPGQPAFDAWLELERESLHTAWRSCLANEAQRLLDSGSTGDALARLATLLDDDPLAEDVVQMYLRYCSAAGARRKGLLAFERFNSQLRDELALDPLPETLRLVEAVRSARAPTREIDRSSHRPLPPRLVGTPPLVGRGAEIEEARNSTEELVWLAGEPGAGKTRLIAELAPGTLVVSCAEGLQSIPFAPLVPVLRELLQAGGEVPGSYAEDLARIVPEAAPDRLPSANPGYARGRLLEAVTRLLEAEAPTADRFELVFEDVQWADEATLELLAYLVSNRRLRCLASYRPEEVSDALSRLLGALSGARLIELAPLAEEEVRELVAALMKASEGPPLFSRWLHRHTGGNPMFVLQTLSALFEAGELEESGEGWRSKVDDVTRDYFELAIPRAATDVVRRRLQRLSSGARRVLQSLAVASGPVSIRTLGSISGLSEWATVSAIEEAEAAGLLDGLNFRHDLVRRVSYALLPAARAQLLHLRAAEELADSAGPALLAEHWLAGGRTERALAAWLEVVEAYRSRGLHVDALPVLERAMGHAQGEVRFTVMVRRARLLKELGQIDEAARIAAEVEEASQEPVTRAAALDVLANAELLAERYDEAQEHADRGSELARLAGSRSSLHQLASTQAIIAFRRNDFGRALELLQPLLDGARSELEPLEIMSTLTSVAAILDVQGRHRMALPLHLEALDLARRAGARYAQVDAALNLLYCYLDLGEPDRGVAVARDALELGHYEGTDILRVNLATALAGVREWAEAAGHLRELARTSNDPLVRATSWGRLVEAESMLGNDAAKSEALEQSLELLPSIGAEIGRARLAVSILRFGSTEQIASVEDVIAAIDGSVLPAYLRDEFEASLAGRREAPSVPAAPAPGEEVHR